MYQQSGVGSLFPHFTDGISYKLPNKIVTADTYSTIWKKIIERELAGFVFGGVVGFLINYLITRKHRQKMPNMRRKYGEVILSVYCTTLAEAISVEDILLKHYALGVAKLDR